MIVFAAIAPHGGPIFDQPEAPTRRGMEELGRRFAAARPDAVIVLTPHGLHVDGHFAVVRSTRLEGDAAQWTDADTRYEGPGDPELAAACVHELQADGHVNVVMQDGRRFVSVSGVARVVQDRALVEKLWSEAWKVWFPKGKDDPSLCLLVVEPMEAAYWDMTGLHGVRYVFEMAKAYVTGTRPPSDELATRHRQLQIIELENRQKLWRWGIVAVLGLLAAETALAGRLARRSLRPRNDDDVAPQDQVVTT